MWKHNRSIRNDGKGFHSPIFVLDESHCTSSIFISLITSAPKCTSRWCLSTGQFFQAAEKTFTPNTIKYGLSENCSFDFKFNVHVPVGFWWYSNWLKLALPLKSFGRGIWIGLKYYKQRSFSKSKLINALEVSRCTL